MTSAWQALRFSKKSIEANIDSWKEIAKNPVPINASNLKPQELQKHVKSALCTQAYGVNQQILWSRICMEDDYYWALLVKEYPCTAFWHWNHIISSCWSESSASKFGVHCSATYNDHQNLCSLKIKNQIRNYLPFSCEHLCSSWHWEKEFYLWTQRQAANMVKLQVCVVHIHFSNYVLGPGLEYRQNWCHAKAKCLLHALIPPTIIAYWLRTYLDSHEVLGPNITDIYL